MYDLITYCIILLPLRLRFYHCLCDSRSIRCKVRYKIHESLNTNDVFSDPFYYTGMDIDQEILTNEMNTTKRHRPFFLCDQQPLENLDCLRVEVSDDTCDKDPDNCQTYMLRLNVSICSPTCVTLAFKEPSSYNISFSSFGEMPTPIGDELCPESGGPVIALNTTDVPSLDIRPSEDAVSTNSNVTNEEGKNTSVKEQDLERAKAPEGSTNTRSPFPTAVVPGILASLVFISIPVVFRIYRYARSREKARGDSSTFKDTPVQTSEVEPSTTGLERRRSDGDEVAGYLTLDEVSSSAELEPNFEEVDAEGYNTAGECAAKEISLGDTKGERKCRPLPRLPSSCMRTLNTEATNSRSPPIVSEKREATSATTTPTTTPTTTATATTTATTTATATITETLRVAPASDASTSKCHQRTFEVNGTTEKSRPHTLIRTTRPPDIPPHTPNPRPHRLVRTTGPPDIPPRIPLPRPHRRRVDLNQHQYVSLVNFRPDPHSPITLNHVTEAKLVRTKEGQLELISVDDELATFTEYYTRLLIINQGQGSLGIVGLLENDTTNSDRREHLDFSDERTGHKTNTSDLAVSSGGFQIIEQMTEDEEAIADFDRACESFLYVYYIGSLDVGHDIEVSPCEYLTVLDTDASPLSFESGEYLTVLDIDRTNDSPMNGSVSSQF